MLSDLRAVCDAAPAGPWRIWPNPMRDDGVFVGQDVAPAMYHDGSLAAYPDGWNIHSQMDHEAAAFIVAARTAMPLLLDVAEAAEDTALYDDDMNGEAARERLTAAIDRMKEEK